MRINKDNHVLYHDSIMYKMASKWKQAECPLSPSVHNKWGCLAKLMIYFNKELSYVYYDFMMKLLCDIGII